MFYLLCFCLVLAVMSVVFVVTALGSIAVLKVLPGVRHMVRTGTAANLLFIFRALPLVLGVIASLGLALPAFLKFEPYSTREMPGPALLLLAGLGLFIVAGIAWRCIHILRVTLALQRRWMENASPLRISFKGIPVFCIRDSASLVAVAGVFVPRIFVSRDVVDMLSEPELNAALSHELAHVNRRDNFRQLVLKITQMPGISRFLSDIDLLWVSTSELAADEQAIAYGTSPLDLSSALVKVGRLALQRRSPLLAASHLVDGCSSATSARVGHLRELLEHGAPSGAAGPRHWNRLLPGYGVILLVYVFALQTMLPGIHEALELIVR